MVQANNCVQEISFDQFFKETEDVLKPTVYIIKPWVEFLKSNVQGEAIAFEINFNSQKIYTYGFLLKKFGIRMFCSPFEGWNTTYIGFYSTQEITNYSEIIRFFYRFLKKEYKIKYFEITDKNICYNELKEKRIKFKLIKNMNYDLTTDENTLFEKLPRSLKKQIRNYHNHGYSIAKVEPNEDFANLYYGQLIEVFALQNLKPFYSLEKVKSLLNSFKDYKENILCLKSFNLSDNSEIGTAIFLTYKNFAITFGSASYTAQKKSNMNHVVRWEAIKHFKDGGVTFFDFGGYNPYKSIFEPNITLIPCIHISSIPFLYLMKCFAKKMIEIRRKLF